MAPIVSVLVPVHNAGSLLRATVESVLAQTCSDFELILMDDGSTDNCMASLAGVRDERIRVFVQAQRGAPAALNAGLERASGEFIAFMDHDDLWLPSKLERHLDCFASYANTDLTFDWSRMIDEEGKDLGLPSRRWKGTIAFEELLEDFVIGSTSAIVVRKAAIDRVGALNPMLTYVYDIDLCLRVVSNGLANCRSVPQCLTLYRRHVSQMSGDWRKLQQQWESLLTSVPSYSPVPVAGILPVADSNMRRYFAWIACEQRDYSNALRLELSAFGRAPASAVLDARNWMLLAAAISGVALPDRVHLAVTRMGKSVFRLMRDR